MKTLLKNGMIATMNSRKEILQNSDLLIEGDRIQRLFPGTAYGGSDVDHVIDCQGKIILPGLISAHTLRVASPRNTLCIISSRFSSFIVRVVIPTPDIITLVQHFLQNLLVRSRGRSVIILKIYRRELS